MDNRVRPIAICVFSHRRHILVAEAYDMVKREVFYRPLGGTIEFGERGQETIRREIREELGAEIAALRFLGTLENIFTYQGQLGHEIVLVYDGDLVDHSLYRQAVLQGYEKDIDEPFQAVWKHLDEFGVGRPPVYPDGLLTLLRGGAS